MIAVVGFFINGRRLLLALSAPVLLQLKFHRGRGRAIPFRVASRNRGRFMRMLEEGWAIGL